MKNIIDVSTGEVKLGSSGDILRSIAIGSCIVVAAYNFREQAGAMAHIMLPGQAPKNTREKTKYAADAIDKVLRLMSPVQAGDIEVCLVGAGNVLKKKDDSICENNIDSVTCILKEKNIPVRASVLGGTERKGIFLDIETGSISYTEGDEEKKTLWKPETPS